jgi:hypothetical protein
VGSPQEAAHVDRPTREVDEHSLHFRSGSCEELIRVALPVGEPYCVAGAELAELPIQAIEIRCAVDEQLDAVASRPRRAVGVPLIDVRGVIATLVRIEEPVSDLHRPDTTEPAMRACHASSPRDHLVGRQAFADAVRAHEPGPDADSDEAVYVYRPLSLACSARPSPTN